MQSIQALKLRRLNMLEKVFRKDESFKENFQTGWENFNAKGIISTN